MNIATATVSIIGPGALGGALIDLLLHRTDSFSLHSVWGRTEGDCYLYNESGRLKSNTLFPSGSKDLGTYVFITTPDDVIDSVANKLADLPLAWNQHNFIHFSGSHSSELLSSLHNLGANVASLHPLQTFTEGDRADRFNEIWFTLEGNESLFPALQSFVQQAGSYVKQMSLEQKKSMHLAAVFASNYLVSLMGAVEQVTHNQAIENGVEMLNPLIRQTLTNIFDKGVLNSLSGPISRADESTIRDHLERIESQPDLVRLYKQLGLQAVRIATESGRINNEKSNSLKILLSGDES